MRKHSERYNNMIKSSSFNEVYLEVDLLGCWNTSTGSGWVEDASGNIVQDLDLEPDLDDDNRGYIPCFTKQEFVNAGYVLYPDF
jgi:hypothetical protein